MQPNNQTDPIVSQTRLRVHVLGPTRIEYWDPDSRTFLPIPEEQLHIKGAQQGLALMELLISQPQRTAHRDWVLEQFWPSTIKRKAEQNLDNMSNYLHTLLDDLVSNDEVLFCYVRKVKSIGGTYRLAQYPLIWVDADALIWHRQHASLYERMGDDPLPFLEAAHALGTRGTYLPEAPYCDWATTRRAELDGAFSFCVHRLGDLYLKRGRFAEAELVVRPYWAANMVNEDALRLLMNILGKQERFQEVYDCYQQTCEARERTGERIDPRLNDRVEYWRSKPLQPLAKSLPQPAPVSPSPTTNLTPIPVASSKDDERQRIMHGDTDTGDFLKNPNAVDSVREPSDAVSLLKAGSILGQEQLTICWQQQRYIQDQIQRGNTMSNEANQPTDSNQITRRDLIELAFVAAPVLTNVQRERPRPFMVEEFLSEATASITACWHLLRGDGLSVVERAIPQYLSLLEGLVKHSSLYRQRAAYLVAQGYSQLELIAEHRLRFVECVTYAEKAVEYAQESGDLTLLVECMRNLGSTFRNTRQYAKMLDHYLQAEHHSKKLSGLLHSKVLAKLSLGHAQQGNRQEVTRCVGEAETIFAEADDQTPVFLSATYGLDQVILDGGRSILALGKHALKQGDADLAQQYWDTAVKQFGKIKHLPSGIFVLKRIEVEFETNWAFVYASIGNMEAFITHFHSGLQGANELRSGKRKQEAIDSLIVAIQHWQYEPQVTDLLSLLR